MEVLLDAALQDRSLLDSRSAGTDVAAQPQPARDVVPVATPAADPLQGTDSYHRADGSVQLAGQQVTPQGRGGGGDPGPQPAPQSTFSSTGDPLLAFDGVQNGAAVHTSFSSEDSHVDLIASNDIVGGFQVAARVAAAGGGGTGRGSAPQAAGNQSVAVVANYGANVVTVNADGQISVVDNGQALAVQTGASYTLTGGEKVDISGDGVVSVTLGNAAGGSVTTTLTASGSHVDVTGTAQGLTFQGDILAGASAGGPPPGGGRGNPGIAGTLGYTGRGVAPSGGNRGGGPGPTPPPEPPPAVATETVSSTGDPHLRFTEHDGSLAIKAHYDDQTAHVDLADTSAVAGGFRISTQVTPVNRRHVAYNDEVTLSSDFFQDTIVVTKDALHVTDHGANVTVANGHSYTLADGETITRSKDGKTITVKTAAANGSITTVLHQTKQGVDVTAKGIGVKFGGDIVRHVIDSLA